MNSKAKTVAKEADVSEQGPGHSIPGNLARGPSRWRPHVPKKNQLNKKDCLEANVHPVSQNSE